MALHYSDFVGGRLQLAREFKGLTQKELADDVGVDPSMISQVEGLTKKPSSELVAAFASRLGFSSGFFYLQIADPFTAHECHFRHRRDTAVHMKKKVRAHASLLAMVVNALRTKFKFPTYNVPQIDVSDDAGIERAAMSCRNHWGLPLDQPIRQISRVLEHAGVMVMSHVGDTEKIDAFSRYGPFSMIFLNMCKHSTSRRYFDVAHEAGHLVLHRDRPTGDPITENQANRFASALLLPSEAFASDFAMARCSVSHLIGLKRKWLVSAAAILRRGYELGLLEIDRYRSLQKQTAVQWKGEEPFEPTFTTGEIFATALTRICLKTPTAFGELADRMQCEQSTLIEVTGFNPSSLVNVVPFDGKVR